MGSWGARVLGRHLILKKKKLLCLLNLNRGCSTEKTNKIHFLFVPLTLLKNQKSTTKNTAKTLAHTLLFLQTHFPMETPFGGRREQGRDRDRQPIDNPSYGPCSVVFQWLEKPGSQSDPRLFHVCGTTLLLALQRMHSPGVGHIPLQSCIELDISVHVSSLSSTQGGFLHCFLLISFLLSTPLTCMLILQDLDLSCMLIFSLIIIVPLYIFL